MKKYENLKKGTKNRQKNHSAVKRGITTFLIAVCFIMMVPFDASASEISITTMTDSDDNCTAVYVGSDVSTDGTTLIARCADTHPNTTNVYLNISEASSEPGRVTTGKNGFEYKLPDKTYKYISVPRPAAFEKGHHWDSAASNEKGVAVTATVSGYVCPEALEADPYIAEGLTEDNIAGIVAACSDTAKRAIEILADIIDNQGSGESNMLLVADRKECWYMEIYTGHQYAAVKLPTDYVAGFGNEFMLDSFEGFDNVIISSGIESVPKNNGFAKYNPDGTLNLFNTYAGEGRLSDYANLRTWRIHQILAPSTAGEYFTLTKYSFLYKPENKVGVADLIDIFRDRYEGTDFEQKVSEGKTRVIATETASQIHILQVSKSLPEEIAVTEWMCFSNANYAPFVPISNGVTAASEKYAYIAPKYGLDENSAHCIYKKLNTLASLDRAQYGMNIEKMWQEYESVWYSQFQKVLNYADEFIQSGEKEKAIELLNNYTISIQNQALEQAKRTFDDLMWHIMENTDTLRYDFSYSELNYSDEPKNIPSFLPLISVADYAKQYGWCVADNGDSIELKNGDKTITIVPSNGYRTSIGSLTIGNDTADVFAYRADDDVYILLDSAMEYIKAENEPVVNVYDFFGRNPEFGKNNAPVILCVVIAAIALAGIVCVIVYSSKKRMAK